MVGTTATEVAVYYLLTCMQMQQRDLLDAVVHEEAVRTSAPHVIVNARLHKQPGSPRHRYYISSDRNAGDRHMRQATGLPLFKAGRS